MAEIALEPEEVERRRRRSAARLALFEIPFLRTTGFFFLSIGIYLNNRFFLTFLSERTVTVWLEATSILAAYAAISWLVILFAWRRFNLDLTLIFLVTDMVVWSYAIYVTGAEQSRLFFILILRVADQTQTTFRRCLGFVAFSTACWIGIVAWSAVVGGNPADFDAAAAKLVFIAVAGIYIALSARTSDERRRQIQSAMRTSRELIDQLEERTADLREARARAEEANAAKSEFLANMSHEMRTPLHGVIGMLQLARDGEMSAERAHHIELAQQSAQSLLGTIDDVLEFSRIEARKLDLEPVYFSLRELMHDTMKPLGVTAAARGLVISCFIDPSVPDSIWTDPLRFRQIITNLAGNAIKFTQAGEISVRISCEQDNENRLTVRGVVEDTGIGIEPALQKLIFEPFTQVDSSRTRRYSGTGLGLSIVARLVEMMGGTIEVESRDRGGSRFTFFIGAETDQFGAPAIPDWERALQGRRILVVDRHEHERSAIVEMLRGHGMRVDDCAWFDEAPEGEYDCVVATEPRSGFPPVVVVRSPLEHDGTADGISRPVDESELVRAVATAMRIVAPESASVIRMPPRAGEKSLRILVVEDHPIGQEFAMEALRRLGHTTIVAGDGLEAVQIAAQQSFDAILMDVQMPAMDGLEATRRIRALPGGGTVPIIAMTAHTRAEERARCLDAGMNAVLTKPIERRELAEALAGIEPQVDSMLASVSGNPKLLARVAAAFTGQTPRVVAAIHAAIARRDAETLYQQAHKLKGSLSHFPGEALDLALKLESAGRAKEFEGARELMPPLETALRELEARLTAAASASAS